MKKLLFFQIILMAFLTHGLVLGQEQPKEGEKTPTQPEEQPQKAPAEQPPAQPVPPQPAQPSQPPQPVQPPQAEQPSLPAPVPTEALPAPTLPAPAEVKTETQEPAVEKKEGEIPTSVEILTGTGTPGKFPLGGLILIDQSLGIGTFIKDKYARNPYYSWTLSIRPKYFITDKISAEARIDLTQELTQSYGTETTKKHQIMPSDTLLTVKYNGIYAEPYTQIGFSPFIRLTFPSSYESRYHNLYFASGVGFDAYRMLGNFYLTYTFRFTKSLNKYTMATVEVDENAPVSLARLRGNEELGAGTIATGANNSSFSFFNSFMATYIINDEWTVTLKLEVRNYFRYKSFAEDEWTAPIATPGRGRVDVLYGILDVSYQPFKYVGFSLGINNEQPPKTDDNRAFRFPFFDFISEANNYTTFYFDVYATF